MKTDQGFSPFSGCLPFFKRSVFNLSSEQVFNNELQLPCKRTGISYCNCCRSLAGIFSMLRRMASFQNKELVWWKQYVL